MRQAYSRDRGDGNSPGASPERYERKRRRRNGGTLPARAHLGLKNTKLILLWAMGILSVAAAAAGEEPKGVDSLEAYEMVMKDLDHTFIIDVRTRAEYEFVGHPDLPNGVPNIPLMFYPSWKMNPDFVKKVKERFSKDDTLITICRSGGRARKAARMLMEAGFRKVYYITDSFEGPKDERGLRTVSGWKVNGLPYTYRLDENLVYK